MVTKRKSRNLAQRLHSVPLHCWCLATRMDSGPLVLCELCRRWFHEPCVQVKFSDDDAAREGHEEFAFLCRDCNKDNRDVLVDKSLMRSLKEKLKRQLARYERLDKADPQASKVALRTRGRHKRVRFSEEAPMKLAAGKEEPCSCESAKNDTYYRCECCGKRVHAPCASGVDVCKACADLRGGNEHGKDHAESARQTLKENKEAPASSLSNGASELVGPTCQTSSTGLEHDRSPSDAASSPAAKEMPTENGEKAGD
mmetsp:Transcript_2368/g.7086  ORF Transcript_2368/g.7086 Transcript_2368/m.7086 type:complete len:256 (-) Transcript_2368:600-1367(-)